MSSPPRYSTDYSTTAKYFQSTGQATEAHAEAWSAEWPAAEWSGRGAGALWSSRTRQQSGFLWSEPLCCRVREAQGGGGCGRVARRPTVRRIRSGRVLHNPHRLKHRLTTIEEQDPLMA